jgi:Protein of unknown function (DUF3040)
VPLSSRDQAILAGIEDELTRSDPGLSDLLTARAARHADDRPRARRVAVGAALAFAALLLVTVAVSEVGLVDAVLITFGFGMLFGVPVARWHARRVLFDRSGARGPRTP